MKKLLIVILLTAFLSQCNEKSYKARQIVLKERKSFELESSVRAMTYSYNTIGFAGSEGVFGSIDLTKMTMLTSKQKKDEYLPEFRMAVFTQTDFLMLSIGSPALLYKTENDGMKLVYQDFNDKIFYNALAFKTDSIGIAIADPINGILPMIKTTDGGNTWQRISEKLPQLSENEIIFAASNSSLTTLNDKFYFVTGGTSSNIYISDKGINFWKKYSLPLLSGKNSQGAFSVDFYDENQGIVVGGDYKNPQDNAQNIALTFDAGKNWKLVDNTMGYLSCVKYVPESQGNEIIAVGDSGIWFSSDKGQSWKNISKESFYSLICVDNQTIVASGNKKIKVFNIK